MRYFRTILFSTVAFCAHPACAADALKFGPPPAWVRPIPIPTAKETNAPVAMLLENQQTQFEHGKIIAFGEGAFKIVNAQGLAAGNVAIVWQPATDTVTVNWLRIRRGDKVIDVLAAGQTFTVLRRETNLDAATLDGTLTATIQPEGLQAGDIIEFATTTERSDPVLKGHVETMFGAWGGLPVQTAYASISWPNDFHLQIRQTPNLPTTQRSLKNGINLLELSAQNVEPLVPPKGAPDRFKIGRLAEATDFASWADLSNLFMPLFRDASAIPATGPLHDEVEKIRMASNNPKARAEQALTLVQDRVRYVALLMGQGGYVPAPAETTWSRRFGDCKAKTALLLGILHSLGIQAEPVLVQATLGDMIADRLPMVALFNHVLVRAHIGGRDYWLDGTRTGDTDLDAIKTPDFGWGLPLIDRAQLVRMVPEPLTSPSLERHVAIDASAGIYAPATIEIDEVSRGDSAVQLNAGYSGLTAEQRDQQLHDEAKSFFDAFTSGSSSVQFDKAKGEFHINIKGTAKLGWKDGWFYVPTSVIAFDPDFDRTAGPLHDVPMAVNHPTFVKDEATIRLPHGVATLQKLQTPVHETLAGVEYTRSEAVSADTITVDSSERSVAPEVPYKDAVAAETRLRTLYNDDVYLQKPVAYVPSEKDLTALAQSPPSSADEYVDRGNLFLNSFKFDEAITNYTGALTLDPKNVSALADRGLAYVWKHQFNLAEADLNSVQTMDPNNAVAFRARGLMAEMSGRFSDAIDFYTKSLAVEPESGFSLLRRANARASLGDASGALADFESGSRYQTNQPANRLYRALFEVNIGRLDDAKKDLAAASASTPAPPGLAVVRGMIADLDGDHKAATEAYTEGLRDQPGNPQILMRRASAYSALHDETKALADSDAALKAGYKDADVRLLRANIFYKQGNREATAREAELAMSEHPDSEYAFVLAGKVFGRLGLTKQALNAFDRAIALNPAPYVYVNRALVRPASDVEGQLADYDAALKLEPNMPEAITMKAALLSKHERYAEALAIYDRMPKSPDADFGTEAQRAVILAKAGRAADASKEFAELRSRAKSADDLNSLCWAEGTGGVMLEAAVQECRDAVKLSHGEAEYEDSLGMALLRSGKLKEALSAYNLAIEKGHIASSYMGRAIILSGQGDKAHAQADLTEAKKLDPNIENLFADYGLKL